jgi:hypothetical protein
MKKLVLTSIISVALFAAVTVGSASASTVGDATCDSTLATVCAALGIEDWDGFSGYHCNNVAVQPGDDTGNRPGNAVYTVGLPDALGGSYDDCDTNGSKTITGSSIVLFTGVGYINGGGQGYPDPVLYPDRNPGTGAGGYIAAGGVSAGGRMP